MPPSTPSPHDALFKAAFGQPDVARSVIGLALPDDLRAQLDLSTLAVGSGSFVDRALEQSHGDLLFTIRTRTGAEALVYVLFEHQSSPDPAMPLRLLGYVVRIWEQWLAAHRGASSLPIVLPLVLHHGDGAWRRSPELASMFEGTSSELLEAARPYLPHFRFLLDDLSPLTATELASRALDALPRLVQLALWASRSLPRLREAAPRMRAVLSLLAWDLRLRQLVRQLSIYAHATAQADVDAGEIQGILLEIFGTEGKEEVMNSAEQLRLEGRAEGLQGLRDALMTALSLRGVLLSDTGRERVAACIDAATLTGWLKRAISAATEVDVFADDGAGSGA